MKAHPTGEDCVHSGFPRISLLLLPLLLVSIDALASDPSPGGPKPSAGVAPAASSLPEPVPFDSATTARYHDVSVRLAAALATGDTAAFRALHSEAGWEKAIDWWREMLRNQRRALGEIVRVVGPLRGQIRMGGTGLGLPAEGAAILCHLGDKAGASMSFTLDADGRIAESSVWVARELAGAHPEGAEVLWETPSKKGGRP